MPWPWSQSPSVQRSKNLDTYILSNLKTGKLDGIDKDVHEYLLPVLTGEIKDVKKHGLFTVQFLHTSLKTPGDISTGLLEAVEHCYKCYNQTRNQIELSEALTVPKLLYHIMTRIPIKGFHFWRISLCNILYDELASVTDDNRDILNTIASSTHGHVWNLSVKQEQQMEVNDWSILQLRHMALKILLLKDGTVNTVMEKLVLVLTRFEKTTFQKEKKLDESEFPVVNLVTDILTSLHRQKLTDEEQLSPLSLFQFLFRYGIQYDIVKAVECGVESVIVWSERFQKDTDTDNIYRLFLYIGTHLLHCMGQCSEKGLTEEILSKIDLSKEKLTQIVKSEDDGKTLQTILKSVSHDKLHIVVDILLVVIRYIEKIGLHTEDLLPVFQSYVKLNCVLLSWKPTQDKYSRMVVDLVQIEMKIIFDYMKNCSDVQFCSSISLCEEITQNYDTLLCDPQMKSKDQDSHYCGYVMSKLAQMCFEKEMFQSAILFNKIACLQLSRFVNSEKSLRHSRMEEVSLGKVYIRLAETYLKYGEMSVAMETITSCLLVDDRDLTHAVMFWVKVKKDILKTGKDDIIKKSLGQSVYEQDNSMDLCGLLQLEHNTFKSSRKRYYEAEIEILLQLISVANEPFVKGKALLEMAHALWQSGLKNDSDIVGYLRESEEVLCNSTGTGEILGQVVLWQYIVSNEESCRQILSSINVSMETVQTEPGEDTESPVIDKSFYMTVAKELEAVKQMDRAVALWESLDDNIRDVNLLLQSVLICSRIYQLLKKPDKQLQVMKIYHRLSGKHVTKVTTDAITHMIDCLLSVDMVTEAEKFVDGSDDWDKQTFKEETVNYQIVRSHFLMHNKQYEAGISILKDVLTLISQKQNSTWFMLILEGRAKRLMSQFLTFPGHVTSDYCLDYACEAVRFHTGVVHFLMGKEYLSDVKKGKSIDKWTALIEILESLYNLGCLYCHIGEAREAKCYLKEGWKVARYYGLPAWNVKFSSQMIKLHCISDKSDEAVSTLLEIAEVLPSSEELLSPPTGVHIPVPTGVHIPVPAGVHIPECLHHILEENYCNYCRQYLAFVLKIVPVVAETYVTLNDEKAAILFLENFEKIVYQLVREGTLDLQNEGSKIAQIDKKAFQLLYIEIVTNLAELHLNVDTQRCQQFLDKAADFIGKFEDTQNVLLTLRHGLCQALCSVNWQSLQHSSSSCDQEKEEKQEDFLNCLPLTTLTNKFERMSVKVDEGSEKNDDNQFNEGNKMVDRQEGKVFGEDDNIDKGESNLKNDKNKKMTSVKNEIVKKDVKEPKRKNQNMRKTIEFTENTEESDSSNSMSLDRKEKRMVGKKDNSVVNNKKEVKSRRNTKPKSKDLAEPQLTEDNLMETPNKAWPKLVMKTPRSVCSHKTILDLILDSDEDDVQPLKSRKKTRPSSRKQPLRKDKENNTDVFQFSEGTDVLSAEMKNAQSKIPRPVLQKALFGTEKDGDVIKCVKKRTTRTRRGKAGNVNTEYVDIEASRHGGITEDDAENILEEVKMPCDNHVTNTKYTGKTNIKRACRSTKVKIENDKSVSSNKVKAEISKQNDSSSRNLTEKVNDEDNNKNIQKQLNVCDADKHEADKKKSKISKIKNSKEIESMPSRRTQRSRVNATERTRSDSDSEDDKLFILDESLSVKDDESVTGDTYHCEDLSFSVRSRLDTEDYDSVVLQEVTENDVSLNESIEILRGDNKTAKATRKGRTQKKTKKDEESDCEQQAGETTEVLRSSKLLKRSQMKTERIVKAEPVPKTDSNISKCDSTNSRLIQTLEEAYKQMKHLPSPPIYTSICQMLALQYMELSPLKAAFYLAESIAVTFRHQSLINAARKIRKSIKASDSSVAMETSTDVDSLQKSREILHFNKTEEEFKAMMTDIPEDWSVCQLSVVSQSTPGMLVISRVDKTGQPIVVQLPEFNSHQGREILSEFSNIINESKDSVKLTDKNEWWKWRGNLDSRMQTLLENIEKYWLGRWKFLLLGHPVGIDVQELNKTTDDIYTRLTGLSNKPINKAVIKILLGSGNKLTVHQIHQVLANLSGADSVSEISTEIAQFWSKHVPCDSRRHHVILLLDKTLQHLPWENIPILRSHSLSRLPSLYHMISYLSQKGCVSTSPSQKRGVSVVDKNNVYYVLNPDNNLPATQETFQHWFEKNKGWQGIVGKPPTAEENKKALTEYDLLVYCGHGTGSKYLSGDDLQQLSCRAAVLLMGCSSGQLQTKGQLEASGMMLNYFLANCPCIISNLWDVTDKDIDRFLEHLLQACMCDKSCEVLSVIQSAREVCRLPFLIGAAPVVYGFPIITK